MRRTIESGLKRMPDQILQHTVHSYRIGRKKRRRVIGEHSIRSSAKIVSDKANTRESSLPNRASTIVGIVAISDGSFSVKRVLKHHCVRSLGAQGKPALWLLQYEK